MSDLALSPANPTEAKAPVASRLFTAAQIAAALGRSKRGILLALDSCPQSGTVLVGTNEAKAWAVAALPEPMKAQLARAARRGHYRAIEDCIDASGMPWDPGVPAASIPAEAWDKARKLREAMVPMLERMDSFLGSKAEFEASGVERYQRAFGHAITTRYWRELLSRTLRRDAGQENWGRLELYLEDQALSRPKLPAPAAGSPPAEYEELTAAIAGWKVQGMPNGYERAALWDQVFSIFEAQVREGKPAKRVKRDLLAFLWQHARPMADSEAGMRKSFGRKLQAWLSAGRTAAALLDGREQKRGERRAPAIPQDDLDALIWEAARNHGGRVRQAARAQADLGEHSLLSEQTRSLLMSGSRDKSYLNRRIADAVKYEVRAIAPHLQGPKAIDDSTPSVERDYSALRSMDIVCADDFTMPVYFYVPDGKGWFTLTRGQCLIFIDVRSLKVIAWSLQPERNYNAQVIATLMNQICRASDKGVPSTWYFECGIWKRANLVKRPVPINWKDGMSWLERKSRWESFGVRFVHAIRARTKPIELIGGMLQNLMFGLPGYCGRDERRDCPEATKLAKADVESGRKTPEEVGLYSFEQWDKVLGELIERYNATVQQGRILDGISPDQAFQKFWPHSDPPKRFDAACWHLCAHMQRKVKVPADGVISFTMGREHFRYFNRDTGKLRGNEVLIWFDPEMPDLLGVTDLNEKNPLVVQRSQPTGFLAAAAPEGSPERETYIAEMEKAAQCNQHPKARFHVLKEKFTPTTRQTLVDRDTAMTAMAFKAGREQLQAQERDESSLKRQIDRLAGKMSIPRNTLSDDPRTLKNLQERWQFERQFQPTQAGEASETTGDLE